MTAFPAILDLTTLDGDNGFILFGDEDTDAFAYNGAALAGVGDMNGDGKAEVLVGAPIVDAQYNGLAILVRGTDADHAPREALYLAGGSFRGQAHEYEYFGQRVGGLGDINGDGFADAIIGGTGGSFQDAPANYVVFGGPDVSGGNLGGLDGSNGFKIAEGSISGVGDINGDGFDDFRLGNGIIFGKADGFSEYFTAPVLDGTNGFTLVGDITTFGAAGDFNGDGFDDLIVGNAGGDTAGTDAGEAYIIFGKASGFGAMVDVSAVDGVNGVRITGADAGDDAGLAAYGVGDVNGDGFDDVMVGSNAGGGRAYIVFGTAGGLAGGIDLGDLDSSTGFAVDGTTRVGGVGDINGDTLDDLSVGLGGILFGRAGVSVRDLSLADLDGENGFRATAPGIRTCAAAGDINGDGFDDLVLANPFAQSAPNEYGYSYPVGEIYFVFGRADGPRDWTGTSADELFVGSASDDVLNGAGGHDHLKGVGGDDMLTGSSGSDILDGGAGTDTVGFASSSAGVIVDLAAGTSSGKGLGNDTLIDIENVIGSKGDDDISGDDGPNRIDGGPGADRMAGRDGDDVYVVDNLGDQVVELADQGTDSVETALAAFTLGAFVENLTHTGTGGFAGTGNAQDNVILGSAGDDILDGRAGADHMEGGDGSDRYFVDQAGDIIVDGGITGIDRVDSTVSFTMGADIENLLLRGAGHANGTGNTLDNVMTGNGAANRLEGGDGSDRLSGLDGDDTLRGGDGADRLAGGAGADRMYGGLGDDIYIVDSASDTVSEAGGGGIDQVRASVGFTLGSGVEDLILITDTAANGTGNSLANTITGGAGANILTGLGGDDMLRGGGGDDTFAFAAGFGHDTVADFSDDTIAFQGGVFADYADAMAHAAQVGGDVVITRDVRNSITIEDTLLADLTPDAFVFLA